MDQSFIQLNIFESKKNISLLINGDSIDDVNFADFPVTYAVFEQLVKSLNDHGYNVQENLSKLLLIFNPDFNLPKKISNLTRKIQRDISNKSCDTAVDIVSWKVITSIPYLNEHVTHIAGIAVTDLLQSRVPRLTGSISVGSILRLRAFRRRKGLPWSLARHWMKQMFGIDDVELPSESAICSQWDRLYERKCKDGKHIEGEEYRLPKNRVDSRLPSSDCTVENCLQAKQLSKTLHQVQDQLAVANDQVNTLTEALTETSSLLIDPDVKLAACEKLQGDHLRDQLTITKLKTKLQVLKPRNVIRREARKDQKIGKLKEDVDNKNTSIESLTHTVDQLRENLERVTKEKIKAQKQSSYHKIKVQGNMASADNSELVALKDTVHYYENENSKLQEQVETMNVFLGKITTFHGGKYNDVIREVYAALLSMNVGVANVERIVRLVLQKLGNVEVDRLPKKTFAEMMLVESKLISQMQAVDAMISSNCNTLHMDGTKRSGLEYGGVQVSTDSGQYSLGISELVHGNTECFLDMIKTQLSDMADLRDGDDQDQKTAELLNTIKNLMSDRHVVNTSLKSRLEVWREQCLPLVIDNFEALPADVRKKMIELNDFKCNLHVLVNLGSQAESALRVWEQVALDCPDSTEQNFSTSTAQFIRAATKLCVPGADEKSGYGLLFDTYLKSLDSPVKSKLHTFHGHRINIVFSLGAAVFYHHQQIARFVKEYFAPEQKNKLVLAVEAYVNNPVYIAGCRAMGIIDKLLTGPVWRQIEEAKHILDLNNMWLTFKNHMAQYSKDASDLVKGKILYPDHTNSDDVFKCLFEHYETELEVLTREALEVCCLNFLIIIQRQLVDCLPGGKFYEPGNKNQKLCEESTTVRSTNIVSERDFASLDRLHREKPNANTIALEGMLLYSSNNTLQWLDSLDAEKKAKVMESARQKAPDILAKYRERKANIKAKLITLLQTKKEEKLAKEKRAADTREKVTGEIMKYGGLWKTEADMDRNIDRSNEKLTLLAVKAQIRFRKLILNSRQVDKTLLSFSKDGKVSDLQTLFQNLKILMQTTASGSEINGHLQVQQEPAKTQAPFKVKSKEERDKCMAEHRTRILQKLKEIEEKQESNSGTQQETSKSGIQRQRKRKPKRKRNNSETEDDEHQAETPSVLDTTCDVQKPLVVGETIAVAFDTAWYPGNVIAVSDDKANVNFLHPTSAAYTSFRWPASEDISEVDSIFVIDRGFELIPKDNWGRLFQIAASSLDSIRSRFAAYKTKHFE